MRYTLRTFPLRVNTGLFADTFGQLSDNCFCYTFCHAQRTDYVPSENKILIDLLVHGSRCIVRSFL